MKICPICKKSFADELNFCLEDGGLLVERESYEAEKTLSLPEEQTQIRQQVITNQTPFNRQTTTSRKSPVLGFVILFGFGILVIFGMIAAYFLLRPNRVIEDPPDIYRRSIPTPTPTPKVENNVKVEILEKVTDGFGKKFLKCKVTNISQNSVDLSFVGLSFYKGDVKIRDSGADLTLKILKPNQTIPIWVNLYGTDGYTSVKVKEQIFARPITKPIEQIFPQLEFSQTKMKVEAGYMSVNFRQYKTNYHKVSGIVENSKDEKISPQIFVLYYDANGEIIGISSTSVTLEKGEKTKFEVSKVVADMFGKPKTFEIIAISRY